MPIHSVPKSTTAVAHDACSRRGRASVKKNVSGNGRHEHEHDLEVVAVERRQRERDDGDEAGEFAGCTRPISL